MGYFPCGRLEPAGVQQSLWSSNTILEAGALTKQLLLIQTCKGRRLLPSIPEFFFPPFKYLVWSLQQTPGGKSLSTIGNPYVRPGAKEAGILRVTTQSLRFSYISTACHSCFHSRASALEVKTQCSHLFLQPWGVWLAGVLPPVQVQELAVLLSFHWGAEARAQGLVHPGQTLLPVFHLLFQQSSSNATLETEGPASF